MHYVTSDPKPYPNDDISASRAERSYLIRYFIFITECSSKTASATDSKRSTGSTITYLLSHARQQQR